MFDIYCIFGYHSCKRGEMRVKKRATARLNEERHREPANCFFSIANQVAVDLLGHRERHVRRESLPVVASSRVPVRRDVQRGGFTSANAPDTPLKR